MDRDSLAEKWYNAHRHEFPDKTDDEVSDLAYQTVDAHLSRVNRSNTPENANYLRSTTPDEPTGFFSALTKAAARGAARPWTNIARAAGVNAPGDFIDKTLETTYGPGANVGRRIADIAGETAGEYFSGGKLFQGLGKVGGKVLGTLLPKLAPAIEEGAATLGGKLASRAGAGVEARTAARAFSGALPGEIGKAALFNATQGNTNPFEAVGFGALGALHAVPKPRARLATGEDVGEPVGPPPEPEPAPVSPITRWPGAPELADQAPAVDIPIAPQPSAKAPSIAPDALPGRSIKRVRKPKMSYEEKQATDLLMMRGIVPKGFVKVPGEARVVKDLGVTPEARKIAAEQPAEAPAKGGRRRVFRVGQGEVQPETGPAIEPAKPVQEPASQQGEPYTAQKLAPSMSHEQALYLLRNEGKVPEGWVKIRTPDGKYDVQRAKKEGGAPGEPERPFRKRRKSQ